MTRQPGHAMRIGIVFNSKSGRGRAAAAMQEAAEGLAADGHRLTIADVASTPDASHIAADGAEALVVVGGDGSVHHSLAAARNADAAIYHLPMGTENLFARQFGMTRDVRMLRKSVERGNTTRIDLGNIAGDENGGMPGCATLFGLMLSIGMDAAIIHRMAAGRKGAISHLTYATPILLEMLRPTLRPVHVRVDGRSIVDGEAGLLIIANSRQYALRLDPAARADMQDGKLDVVFLPASGILGATRWYAAAALRDHMEDAGARYAQGKAIKIEAGGMPAQIDGEAWKSHCSAVDVEISPACLRVLLPAGDSNSA